MTFRHLNLSSAAWSNFFSINDFDFPGFLSGIALKKYSFRQVGLVGAGLFVLGDVMTIFVQRTYQLVFTFGVVRGMHMKEKYLFAP